MILKNKIAKFLDCELDCNSGQLNLSGVQQNLEPLVFQFLLLLIQHQGDIVSKQSVIDQLWVDKKPTDEALRAMVKKTREALKDDARNPSYIKTIPTKGYVLIPPVALSSTLVQTWFQANKKLSVSLGLFVTFSVVLLMWYLFIHQPPPEVVNKIVLSKTKIANIPDKKVSTYYIDRVLTNISISNDHERDVGHLIIDNIEGKQQQKIVFNSHLYDGFWWSKASQRLLVMRNDSSGFYMVQFYKDGSDPFVTLFEVALDTQSEVLAFDYQGTTILVRARESGELTAINLQANESISKPMLKYLESWSKSKQIELNAERMADVKLYPANNSDAFMAILHTQSKSFFQLYTSLDDERPAYEFTSSQEIVSAIWNESDERFSFTTSDGQLFSFQISALRLTSWNSGGESISRIVVDCASDCFIVANTQDLPKLSEITNPFRAYDNSGASSTLGQTNDINDYAQFIKTNSITRNESLPIYSEQGLYFIEQSANKVAILFRANNNKEEVIYSFENKVAIDELVLDNDANFLAGVVNQRPFVLDLSSRKLRFIPLTLPIISHLSFDDKNDLLYFGKTIDAVTQASSGQILQNTQQTGRRTAGLYEYNLNNQQSRLIEADIKVRQTIDLTNTVNNAEVAQKARFEIDAANRARVVYRGEQEPLSLGLLSSSCISCWQIKGNYFYTLSFSPGNDTSIKRINLLNGEQEQLPILLDSVLKHFALHPNNQKVMLSTRQNLQTELTRIEGFRQMF